MNLAPSRLIVLFVSASTFTTLRYTGNLSSLVINLYVFSVWELNISTTSSSIFKYLFELVSDSDNVYVP